MAPVILMGAGPGDPELMTMKLRSHDLSAQYSRTGESETELRSRLAAEPDGRVADAVDDRLRRRVRRFGHLARPVGLSVVGINHG